MRTTDTLIIGAGQAGLAVSWHLRRRGVDHVVLDAGRIADRWRHERWDSLRTLTPNWMTRLPGSPWTGPDADGFLPASALADHLEGYARSFGAPVEEATRVVAVRRALGGFSVDTTSGCWFAAHLVLATG